MFPRRLVPILLSLTIEAIKVLRIRLNTGISIISALDCAFHGGDLVDLLIRYKHVNQTWSISDLLEMDHKRNFYRQQMGLRFALKKFIGDMDYYNYESICEFSDSNMLHDDLVSNIDLWKLLFSQDK